jgi:hypothetical protein
MLGRGIETYFDFLHDVPVSSCHLSTWLRSNLTTVRRSLAPTEIHKYAFLGTQPANLYFQKYYPSSGVLLGPTYTYVYQSSSRPTRGINVWIDSIWDSPIEPSISSHFSALESLQWRFNPLSLSRMCDKRRTDPHDYFEIPPLAGFGYPEISPTPPCPLRSITRTMCVFRDFIDTKGIVDKKNMDPEHGYDNPSNRAVSEKAFSNASVLISLWSICLTISISIYSDLTSHLVP